MSTRSLRSEYQPLVSQEDESDLADDHHASSSNPSALHPRTRRAGSIDLTKLDNAFKRSALFNDPITCGNSQTILYARWTESIAQKVKRKKKTPDHSRKHIWRSVFEPAVTGPPSPYVCLYYNAFSGITHGYLLFIGEDSGSQATDDTDGIRRVSTFNVMVTCLVYPTLNTSVVHSVKDAINEGIHPKMITKGSSGSYFARAKVEGRVQTVA